MQQRGGGWLDLQRMHLKMIGPDWIQWNLYDCDLFLKALNTADSVERDELFEREISWLTTRNQAIEQFPELLSKASKYDRTVYRSAWNLLKLGYQSVNQWLLDNNQITQEQLDAANYQDNPFPLIEQTPPEVRAAALDRNIMQDFYTVVATDLPPGPVIRKPRTRTKVDYLGSNIARLAIDESWISVRLSDDGNHQKLGEFLADTNRNGVFPGG